MVSRSSSCFLNRYLLRRSAEGFTAFPARASARASGAIRLLPTISVAGGAWIGNVVLVRHDRGGEPERVGMHGRTLGFDLRHVTGHALASCAAGFVVRMFLDSGGARTIRRLWAVTIQADLIGRLS